MVRKLINFAAAIAAMLTLWRFIQVSMQLGGLETGLLGFGAALSGGLAAFIWMIPDEELTEWFDFGEEEEQHA